MSRLRKFGCSIQAQKPDSRYDMGSEPTGLIIDDAWAWF